MLYRFGPFLLDTTRHVLSKAGVPVELEPRVFALLEYFVENRGRVLSRDELVRDVWKDSFVSDSAISHAVYTVRKALGDDAKSPSFVRTLHGRGFEFLAEVEKPATADRFSAAPVERDPDLPTSRKRWVSVLGLLVIVAALAWVRWPAAQRRPELADAEAGSSRPTRLLILRIASREPDPELQLLGLGVTDSLLRDLATVEGLDTISAGDAGASLEEAGSLEDMARAVGIDHLLEGSIFRNETHTGARLELRLHFVDPKQFETLELGAFELPFLSTSADLDRFEELRRAIGAEVVQMISPALAPPEKPVFAIQSVEAYRLTMSAYQAMTEGFCDGGGVSRLLHRALDLEPDYGLAYGFLAISQYNRVWACGEPGELLEEALDNLDRARRFGSQFGPEFETTLATILVETGRLEEAWEITQETLDRYPDSSAARYQGVYVLRYVGLLGEAQKRFDRVLEIDPFFFGRGPEGEVPNLLLYQNRFDEYLEALPRSDTAYHRFYRGFAEYLHGNLKAARAALLPAFETQPGDLFGRFAQALLAIIDGDSAAAVAVVSQIEQQRGVHGILDGEFTYKQAQLFALADEPERALASFRRAVEQGFLCTPYFLRDPVLAPLQRTEGFREALALAEKRRQEFAERFGLEAETPPPQG